MSLEVDSLETERVGRVRDGAKHHPVAYLEEGKPTVTHAGPPALQSIAIGQRPEEDLRQGFIGTPVAGGREQKQETGCSLGGASWCLNRGEVKGGLVGWARGSARPLGCAVCPGQCFCSPHLRNGHWFVTLFVSYCLHFAPTGCACSYF